MLIRSRIPAFIGAQVAEEVPLKDKSGRVIGKARIVGPYEDDPKFMVVDCEVEDEGSAREIAEQIGVPHG